MVSFILLHGVMVDVVPATTSRAFAARLQQIGWPVEIAELATDHAAIAGARYDPTTDRYSAAEDPRTQLVTRDVADRICSHRTLTPAVRFEISMHATPTPLRLATQENAGDARRRSPRFSGFADLADCRQPFPTRRRERDQALRWLRPST
ncbi:hypothetical protein ACVWWN_002416 [Mycobacterium sp. URHB0021]|jgi:hypothetical protein